ncbi:hypothetical protein [Streptomyces sp. NBC_01538]
MSDIDARLDAEMTTAFAEILVEYAQVPVGRPTTAKPHLSR